MEKVLLLSGLGPSYGLAGGDLKGTRFDRRLSEDDIRRVYWINGKNYDPLNFTISVDGQKRPLLQRKRKQESKALVTKILEHILSINEIEFESIPLERVWEEYEMPADVCEKNEAKIICLSTTFMWSNEMLKHAVCWINDRYQYTYLILGGKYAALKKASIMEQYKEVDYIITGDGEESLPVLIKKLHSDEREVEDIPNLMLRKQGEVIETGHREIHMTQMKLPEYEKNQEVVMYESMRGCVFSCKFCAWSTGCETFRYKSKQQIIDEWRYYAQEKNVKEIQVIDSNFFMPAKRMYELLEELPKLKVRWKANARTDIKMDEDFVRKLEDSGCVSLKFGFESMSDAVLGYIDKKSTAKNNRLVNEYFSKSTIDTIDSFIIGFPGETPEEFQKTSDYLINEHYGHFHLYVFELEDKCMPIWKEREKYQIRLYESGDSQGLWEHEVNKSSHCVMNYKQAEDLKTKTLREIRLSSSQAIHRTWQGQFSYPLVPQKSRQWNLLIEKYIDQLVYLPADYEAGSKVAADRAKEILEELKKLGVEA